MDPELLKFLIATGGNAILIWLVVALKAEAKEERDWQREMLSFYIKQSHPDFDADTLKPTRRPDAPAPT